MILESPQKEIYGREQHSAIEAQRLAELIAFGPVIFQVSRLMIKFGIFQLLDDAQHGLSLEEIAEKTNLSRYGAQVLLESSLTLGSVLYKEDGYHLAKTGWFLLHDEMNRVNMDFVEDVNYHGLDDLEEAIRQGKPEGLKRFGSWKTIYEGLSQLPAQVQKSWFGFDHFYSDNAFSDALEKVFQRPTRRLLDVGGNTGKFAMQCVKYNTDVDVTIMDLPQQLVLMKNNVQEKLNGDNAKINRIHGHGADLLNPETAFPTGFDAIWMSQFLDCFSEEEVTSILSRAAKSMQPGTRLYIMETFWNRQRFETASFCLAQISLYFTALANGNSKMYESSDMERCVRNAGLQVETIHDGLGLGHSLMVCKL